MTDPLDDVMAGRPFEVHSPRDGCAEHVTDSDGSITAVAPDRRTRAIALAIHAGRIEAIEEPSERELERMHGSFRADYAGVAAFLEEIAFHGFAVTAVPAAGQEAALVTGAAVTLHLPDGFTAGEVSQVLRDLADLMTPRIATTTTAVGPWVRAFLLGEDRLAWALAGLRSHKDPDSADEADARTLVGLLALGSAETV